ncbi:Fic family protein [Lachnospiraceae bacterium PF1-21]
MKDIKEYIRNNQDYFEDFITRSVYHSNGIEGNTLSYAETYAIIFNDNSFSIGNVKPREIYEAINLKYALSYVLDNLDEPLSESMIKQVGIYINKNISEIDGYRTHGVQMRGVEYLPPAASQVKQAMMYFVHNYNNTGYEDVYEKIADNHIKFERIHPFADGNGRTGRVLIDYELLRNDLPPLVIPQDERIKYFKYLDQQDVMGLKVYFQELSKKELERIEKFQQMPEKKKNQKRNSDRIL